MRTVSTFVGAALGAALLAGCGPSGETVTVVNECENEISVVGGSIGGDDTVGTIVSEVSSEVFGFAAEPLITVISMGVRSGSHFTFHAPVDTSAWNDASEGRRIVVPQTFCAGETDQLAVEIVAE